MKPDGSITTTTYDSKQRIISTVERTPQEVVITGFEYTYDDLDRLIEEKHLDNNTKMCYTYDSLSRVTKKTLLSEEDVVISEENFTYDAAGNITSDSSSATYSYGINNKLATYDGQDVEYDLDGNMLSVQIDDTTLNLQYDSSNKLVSAGGCIYTYNAENTRIRNLCEEEETTYTYNTNCRLSQLLQKTTNGVTTKYVYGRGLIGEETNSVFKTYHFDFRGSTIAITDITGAITDTFKYDTYGKLIERTGTSAVIFGYNGRDGVVTDSNGLIYMRARYYAPDLKRFVNADIIAGEISNAITLNRYAYANANPVSFIDPFGLSAERNGLNKEQNELLNNLKKMILKSGEYTVEELCSGIKINGMEFYCEIEANVGSGDLNITDIAQGQIDLVVEQALSNPNAKVEAITGNEILYGVKYSYKEGNNDVYALAKVKRDDTIVFEYGITTEFDDGSVTTKVGAEIKNEGDDNNQNSSSVEEPSVDRAEVGEIVLKSVAIVLGVAVVILVIAGVVYLISLAASKLVSFLAGLGLALFA